MPPKEGILTVENCQTAQAAYMIRDLGAKVVSDRHLFAIMRI